MKHINWIQGDFFSAKAKIERLRQSKKIGIVSNPPYISRKDIQTLESSVKDFEPLTALDGGKEGIWFYQQLLKKYADIPMFLEIGIDQKNSLVQEVKRYNIKDMSFENDYQDIPRVMKLNV